MTHYPIYLILWLLIGSAMGAGPYMNVGQILAELPMGLRLKQGKQWQQQAAALANMTLGKKVVGQTVKMSLLFSKFESAGSPVYGPVVTGRVAEQGITVGAATVQLKAWAHFKPEELYKLGLTTSKREQS